MRNEEDRPIHLPVPFLKEGTVLFVSPDTTSAGRPDRKDCLSLADLAASLSPEFRAYFFPGAASDLSAAALYRRLQELAGLGDETGLLYRRGGTLYFHPLPGAVQPKAAKSRRRGFRRGTAPMVEAMPCEEPEIDEESILLSIAEEAAVEEREALRKEVRNTTREEAQDPRVQAILDAWEKIEREFGITIEDLQVLLGYQVKLSRLNITTSNRIFLTDFENREVKMDDLTKALYFFFLRHPEGARLKELQDHEPEILRIYSGITGRDDPDKIRESVHNLLDPFANNLNVSLSRIKKAFRDVVGDRIARFYYISGSPAQPRTLPLDRDLVLWAH